MRVFAIKEEWERRGGKVYPVGDYKNNGGILLFDGVNATSHKGGFVVQIDDTGNTYRKASVIINHNSGAELLDFPNSVNLLGPHYFLGRKMPCQEKEGNLVVFAPGGNQEGFWNRVHKGIAFATCFRNELYPLALNLMSAEDFLNFLATAFVVVTAAGVSSLEACSMGKPVLLVKTARDQRINYNGLINNNLALPYSTENLELLINDFQMRQSLSEQAKSHVNKNGVQLVVDRILETYENQNN